MYNAPATSHLGTDLAARYRLERLIGEGATSWVFAARDLRLERKVAVKLLKSGGAPEDVARRLRFIHEGHLLANLAHPHIVAVHDSGETAQGDAFLVMELSLAGSLESELQQRERLAVEETVRLVLPLLGALACVHDRGIIHRDVKPANIALVPTERGALRAKLLDFGIAKPAGATGSADGIEGTPAYMAPEQARGDWINPATDVWAVGVLLFRCLTGRVPFETRSVAALLRQVEQEGAPALADARPDVSPQVAIAIDRALEPSSGNRYADARAFARALGLACRQDGIFVESDPDPIGLPDFPSWLQHADLDRTQAEPKASPIASGSAGHPRSARPRVLRAVLALLAMTASLVGAAFLWSDLGGFAPAASKRPPMLTLDRHLRHLDGSPLAKEVSSLVADPPRPLNAQPVPIPAPARRLRRRGSRPAGDLRRSPEQTTAIRETAPATQEPVGKISGGSEPTFITKWDW